MNQTAVFVEHPVVPKRAGAVLIAAGTAAHLSVRRCSAEGEIRVVNNDYAVGGLEARNVRANRYDFACAVGSRDQAARAVVCWGPGEGAVGDCGYNVCQYESCIVK